MIAFDSVFREYYNKKINEFLAVELFDNFDKQLFYEDLETFFPKHLIREQKEKCAKVIEDLYYWSGDKFMHNLTPLHELGLYGFLESMQAYRDGDQQDFDHIHCDEADEKEVRKIWDALDKEEYFEAFPTIEDLRQYLHDIFYMLCECFEDIDFITFPYLLGTTVDEEKASTPHGLVDFYSELLPADILKEYEAVREKIKSDPTLYEQLSEVLDVIAHGVRYRGWHKLLWNGDVTPKSEAEIHTCLDVWFDAYFGETPVDVLREVDTGTGKIDFTFTNPTESVIIEIKLGSSTRLAQGLKHQLVHYMNAKKCLYAHYVIVCFTEKELSKARRLANKSGIKSIDGDKVINVIILDATQKVPASQLI